MPEHVFETDLVHESFWEELRIRSRLAKATFLITFSGTIACLVTTLYEAFTAIKGPLAPDAKHGLVVPFNDHGVIRYISQTHSTWLDTSFVLYFPFFLALIFFAARSKRRSKSI